MQRALINLPDPFYKWAPPLALFLFGFGLNYYYGRYGFMLLDNSIVFDGAYRILQGQVPFRDFDLPYGLVIDYLQVLFFKLWGVNFYSYLIHGSLFNGFFCLLVFHILNRCSLKKSLSFLYAIGSAFLFYPHMGWPYAEIHAFFFLTLALYLLLIGKESFPGVLGGIFCLVLAFFCKQNPTAFGLPFLTILYLFQHPSKILQRFKYAAFAYGISLLIALLFLLAIGSDLQRFWFDYFVLPGSIGLERAHNFNFNLMSIKNNILNPFPGNHNNFQLWSYFILPATTALLLILKPTRIKAYIFSLSLAASFFLTSWLHIRLTDNQTEMAMGMVLLAVGIINSVVFRIFPKKAAILCSVVFVGVGILDVNDFNREVNQTRIIADLERKNINNVGDFIEMGGEFEPIFWSPNGHYNIEHVHFTELLAKLKSLPGNFMLIGDFTALYGLSGKTSVFPALFFHEGLSIPGKSTPEFALFEDKVMSALSKHSVSTVVLEGERTWMGLGLSDFSLLAQEVGRRTCNKESIGTYTLITLCDQ